MLNSLELIAEASILQHVRHPSIVDLKAIVQSDSLGLDLVFEVAEGDLEQQIDLAILRNFTNNYR